MSTPTVALVHGAFAESSSWNDVIAGLRERGVDAVAIANELRSVASDAQYVVDTLRQVSGPVVLVGHSYGGCVITQAAPMLANVTSLVYVAAFAPDTGESAADLSGLYPGSSLGETLSETPLASGELDLRIRPESFHHQFCADVDAQTAMLMAATQRAITAKALNEPLSTPEPGWKRLPSWFVYGGKDRNIPAEAIEFVAARAGARQTVRVDAASHAIAVSEPSRVIESILSAVNG